MTMITTASAAVTTSMSTIMSTTIIMITAMSTIMITIMSITTMMRTADAGTTMIMKRKSAMTPTARIPAITIITIMTSW